jgi:hypothetical protein
MEKPIFLNDKSYPIQVGTPSGTGRIIQPGFAVEGDYFAGPVSRGMPMRQLGHPEAEEFDKQKIVLSLSAATSGVQPEVLKPYAFPVPVAPVPLPEQIVAPVVKPAPDAVNSTMEQTLNQAMKEMGTQIPTLTEIKGMNMQELNAAALKHGISKASGRADIISQLSARLDLS